MTSHPAAIFVPSPAAWRQSWSTAAIVLAWASLCWLLGEAWLASQVVAPLVPSIALAWFGVGLGVAALAFCLAGCGASFRSRAKAFPLFAAAAAPLLAFAVVWVLTGSDVPLRARFALSEDSLESIADRVEAGEQPMPPIGTLDAGWFTVRAITTENSCTRLTTTVDGDVTGGLARCSAETLPASTGLRFERLAGTWWVWRSE